MNIEQIEVTRIVEDPDQPRKRHDEESLQGLADSIRQHGMLQPITVTELQNVNMYRIITGERRWRAAQKIGMDVIPCIVREADADEIYTQQLIENIQREDLQPLEKANAIRYVKDKIGATNREIGSRIGLSERTVGYLLDLLDLPGEIGEKVISNPNRPSAGQLTEKHARFLKQLNDDPELQSKVVEKIQSEKINSDQTGKLVKALKKKPDQAEQILSSPTDHLVQFFRDIEPGGADETEDPAAPRVVNSSAQRIIEFRQTLDFVRPSELQMPDIRQVLDSLTSLKLSVDGLIRECRLELGEKA
jgi:ParB family transcriptional regulator, chromosome partitioning protein